jgi:dihydropteroate synthase
MVKIIADYDAYLVIMFAKEANGRTTTNVVEYNYIMKTLIAFFEERIVYAIKNGIKKEKIILDPGMGFFISANSKYSFEILNKLKELKRYFEMPILIGSSRKSFLSLNGKLKPKDRLIGTLASQSIALYNGADIIRVHDVKEGRVLIDTMNNFRF